MPPRRKPKCLEEISLASVVGLTVKLCLDIEGKYGSWEHPACPNAVTNAKMYLSTIQPHFDVLCKAILNLKSGVSLGLVLELLMCDKIRTLNLNELHWSYELCVKRLKTDTVFWENQLVKLDNVAELDIKGMQLTESSFEAIGDVCTNLKKIIVTSDLRFSSMRSLLHILKCRELRDVGISFSNWEPTCQHKYTRMIVTGLPNLEHYEPFNDCLRLLKDGDSDMSSTSLTSMRKVQLTLSRSVDVGAVIRLCPNLKDIFLVVDYEYPWDTPDYEKVSTVLKTLAESSLQLDTLRLKGFRFDPEMTRLMASNCTNLTILALDAWKGGTVLLNNIYTIGISCPKIENLRIKEAYNEGYERVLNVRYNLQSNSLNIVDETLPARRMFVHLKVLFLFSTEYWDQRIIAVILRHANNVTDISLANVFKPTRGTSVDALSDLLNANALRELKSLTLECRWQAGEFDVPLSIASIERLMDCCPKLTKLNLIECPMESETIQYFRGLQNDMRSKNFDISLWLAPMIFIRDLI